MTSRASRIAKYQVLVRIQTRVFWCASRDVSCSRHMLHLSNFTRRSIILSYISVSTVFVHTTFRKPYDSMSLMTHLMDTLMLTIYVLLWSDDTAPSKRIKSFFLVFKSNTNISSQASPIYLQDISFLMLSYIYLIWTVALGRSLI